MSDLARITTTEPWHPEMGWAPEGVVTDETFDFVISEMGREGVGWLRLHLSGNEVWYNIDNIVSIGRTAT